MGRILLRDATIVSMDPAVGDFDCANLLIDGTRIAAVGRGLNADGAEVVDMRGRILAPGFVNAHMHTWQTALRSVASNWTLLEYFRWMHAGLATKFAPEDIGIATLVGAWNQLNCGTTTLGDWCHNNPTPAHTNAAVEALLASGIRAVFLHGSPKPDPKPGERHFSEVPHPRHEVERLLKGPLGDRDGLVTLGLALLGPHYSTLDVARHDLRLAREFDLIASMHQGGGPPKAPGGWDALDADGLLGPWVNIVHGNDLSDAQLTRLIELGVTFSITPEGEMTQGHGFPIVGRLRRLKAAPSLGLDLESAFSGDMISVARIALALQRCVDNAESRRERGEIPDTSTIPVREALAWITIEGARVLGLADRVGSLTPGKQADIVAIDARPINMQPLHDPVASVIMQANLANIESVLVAGQWRKRDGRLLVSELSENLEALRRSGRRILGAMGLDSHPGSTTALQDTSVGARS
jgi:cytosine/adenosine deaminase-related metal-dependent hydrolase